MATLAWAVLCQNILVDEETGTASYLNCVEMISTESLPIKLGGLRLGTLWYGDQADESINARVRFIGPDGKVISSLTTDELFVSEEDTMRVHISIPSFLIENEGTYIFEVAQSKDQSKWHVESELRMLVRLIKEESTTAG